jgi:hypothetical protein
MRGELLEAERVHSIVAAFFAVFNYFGGGGMCEAAYKGALEYELTLRGHKVDREVMVPVHYKGKLVARTTIRSIEFAQIRVIRVLKSWTLQARRVEPWTLRAVAGLENCWDANAANVSESNSGN